MWKNTEDGLKLHYTGYFSVKNKTKKTLKCIKLKISQAKQCVCVTQKKCILVLEYSPIIQK